MDTTLELEERRPASKCPSCTGLMEEVHSVQIQVTKREVIPCQQVLQVCKGSTPVLNLLREDKRCTGTFRPKPSGIPELQTMEPVCITAIGPDLLSGLAYACIVVSSVSLLPDQAISLNA